MTLHYRTRETNEAHSELAEATRRAVEKHELTYAELAYCLAQITLAWMANGVKGERKA
jgi:hypothetical protein